MRFDPALARATEVGAQVWEKSPFAEPGLDDRPLRGGTVLEFDLRTLTVTFCSGTKGERSQKKQVQQIQTDTLGLDELNPAATLGAADRPYDRLRLARTIFRAIGDSGSRQRTGYDERLLGWATALWEISHSRSDYEDCGDGRCELFGEPCQGCQDRELLRPPAEELL